MQSEEKSKSAFQVQTERNKKLPMVRNEDVEFSSEKADADDLEALQRAAAADNRQIENQ
jgi:hypothetical protein